MDIGSLQGWIERANGAGWDWFAQQPGVNLERAEALRQEAMLKKRRLASIWADFINTPDGAEALQALVDQTLNRALVPHPELNSSIETTALYAQFREGQNNIVQSILTMAALAGTPEVNPQKRDVT